MADLFKKIKIKKQDGTFTDYIPIGAEAQNVSTSDGESVQLKLNKKPYYYNSVADMKADTKLKVGDMVVTLGYYEINDGGAATYKITDTESETDYQEELESGLFATLVVKDYVTPEMFGAKGDGVTDDSIALQKWLDNHITNKNYVFDISSKTYAISTGLNINYEEEDYLIDFKNATVKALNNMNYMLSVNTVKSDTSFGTDIADKFRRIKGGH